ncbi:hypothetical protein [Flavobacterium hydatis]|uniref:Uncharacterized protein n=1 Tax=Flavobacterium hydatis TaxID=991 RepID=A0A085ZZ25_FLAHY|nr:hypothetical protein [Flavobacterium hydatis]KFF09689.1 hypothetical protein IW20_22655 [Flavobacterium hydatis]OXA91448.1 hypothetical protein B0A62_17375 [Flavobacterium hydatis]
MKANFFQIIIIGVLYLLSTLLYSVFFGFPPFNHGLVIGYPAIYYQFYVSEGYRQFGFTGIGNLMVNCAVILFVFFIFKFLKLSNK